jgi:hypothetical protein
MGLNRGSIALAAIDAKLFHPGQQSCTIHAHANGGSIRAADAPLRFGESAHDPSALLSRIFVSNPAFIVPRSCSFSSHVFGFMQVRRRWLFCFRFLEFCDWSTSGQARYYGNRICSLRCR